MNLGMSMGIIFPDTQNLVTLRMSFDGVTSLIFPISYHDLCAISDILNIKKKDIRASDFKGTSTRACYDVILRLQEFDANLPVFCLPN